MSSCLCVGTVSLKRGEGEGEGVDIVQLQSNGTTTLVTQIVELGKLTNEFLSQKIREGKYINQKEEEGNEDQDQEDDEEVDDKEAINNNTTQDDMSLKKQRVQ